MKIGFLFPGYGSQFVGMGKELYDGSRSVQEYFEEASNCLNDNFVKLCFASSDIELGKMDNAYPALFLVGVSIAALLKERGVVPDIVAGSDIGEYSALGSIGGLTVPDGLYLLRKFSQFYQELLASAPNTVLARIQGVPRDVLKDECALVSLNLAPVTMALLYGQKDHVVAGDKSAIDALQNRLSLQQGVTFSEMPLALGLHSSLMDQVKEQFVVYLTKVDFHDITTPFIAGVDAQCVQSGQDVKQRIVDQINHPLVMDQILDQFESCDLIVEVGLGGMLGVLARERFSDKKIVTVQKQADVDEVLKILGIDNHPQDNLPHEEKSSVSELEIL